MVSTRSKRAEEAAVFFGSQSAVSQKMKKAKAVHNSLAEESRCRITIPDSSNSDTTATIGEGTTPVDVSSSQAEFESSSPRSPTSTSGSNIDKTITSSSHSLSRKDVPDSADGETSVAGVLSSSTDEDKFGKADDQVLPKRFFSTDRYPTRGRVNSYSKPQYLVDILSVLDGTPELVTLKRSPFSSLFELPVRRCSLSGKLVHNFLCRQIVTKDSDELWFTFGGYPLRFSLSEFERITGLPCGPYPSPAKLAAVQTAPEDSEHYWYTLLGREDKYTIEHIGNMLKAEPAMPGWKKIRLSLIVIVEGVLICGTQPIRASLPILEMVRNLDTFFSYPWGRHAFDHTLRMIKVGEKVRNHNILINKLKQKTLVIHGFPIAIQLLLFQSIPLPLRYLPSSEDAQTFYDMSLSVLPTLKTYHTNNILLVENDKDLLVSQSVVSTEEDCVSVGDPKVSHLLSLIRRGYRFSKEDWRGGDASLGKLCICDKKKYCRCNCGPDYSPPNTCTPAPVPGLLPSNADSEAIAKLTEEVAHLKNTYAELYVKLKADVVVEVKSFLEARTCGSCSRNCGVGVGVAASRAESLSAAVVDTLKPVSSSKPLEEEENAAFPSEVKTGKPKAFSSDTGRVYGCVENCSKDVTVTPESRLQTVDPSFQPSVREDDVPSNLQLGQKYLKPMKGRNKREMIASTRCNVNKSPKRQKQGLPGHVDYIPFHPVPQWLSATFKNQLLAYRKSTYDIDGCEVGKTFFSDIYTPQKWIFSTHMDLILRTFWRKRGSYLAAKGIILLDSLFTQLLCSQYSDFVNTASPSAFLWDPLVASYIEGTGGDRTERTTWFKDVTTVYVPMNWGNRHWVGLVICLKSSHIDILDPYLECSSDNEVATYIYMEPLVTMLPHPLKASCDPTDIGVLLDSPFTCHRVEGLPQNTRTRDCGPFVMKLIEMHSHNFSVADMGHISAATVDIFRMDYAIRVYEEFIGKIGL